MKKSLIAIVLILGICFAVVGTAAAICNQSGRIIYSYSSAGTCYYYISSATFPSWVYYYATSDDGLISALSCAKASGQWVYISGSSASCPTTGSFRYGGVVSYVYTY